jgi:hypothetical protein
VREPNFTTIVWPLRPAEPIVVPVIEPPRPRLRLGPPTWGISSRPHQSSSVGASDESEESSQPWPALPSLFVSDEEVAVASAIETSQRDRARAHALRAEHDRGW